MIGVALAVSAFLDLVMLAILYAAYGYIGFGVAIAVGVVSGLAAVGVAGMVPR